MLERARAADGTHAFVCSPEKPKRWDIAEVADDGSDQRLSQRRARASALPGC